jgi:hypothetical protein
MLESGFVVVCFVGLRCLRCLLLRVVMLRGRGGGTVVEIISPYILPRAMVNVYSGEDVDDSEGFMLLRKAEHGTFTSLPASVSIHRVQTSWKATGMYPGEPVSQVRTLLLYLPLYQDRSLRRRMPISNDVDSGPFRHTLQGHRRFVGCPSYSSALCLPSCSA